LNECLFFVSDKNDIDKMRKKEENKEQRKRIEEIRNEITEEERDKEEYEMDLLLE
jgi:CRISPR/Cas system CMR-associated protein Cmr5 small subunit